METVKLKNVSNDVTVEADVLNRTDRTLVVSPKGTTIRIDLHRIDTKKPYVGRAMGIEFEARV